MAPSRMTSTRSATPLSSSNSDDTMRMPSPCSASARTCIRISRFDATSTPTVGSSNSNTDGLTVRFLATTTFCWLPPDRRLDRLIEALGHDLELLHEARCRAPSGRVVDEPWREKRRHAAIRMLSPTECSRTIPARARSSGTSAIPAAERIFGDRGYRSLDHRPRWCQRRDGRCRRWRAPVRCGHCPADLPVRRSHLDGVRTRHRRVDGCAVRSRA